jgi:hypothetical protein
MVWRIYSAFKEIFMSSSHHDATNHSASRFTPGVAVPDPTGRQAVGVAATAAGTSPAAKSPLPRYELQALFISMTFVILYTLMVMVASTAQA